MEERDIYLVPTFCPYDDIINLNEESLKKKNTAVSEEITPVFGKAESRPRDDHQQ